MDVNTSIAARLKAFLEYKNLSIRKFEQIIDITNGRISTVLKNNTDFGVSVLYKISYNFPELNIVWLITGENKMINGNEINAKFVNNDNVKELSITTEQIKRLESTEKEILLLKEMIQSQSKTVVSQSKQIESLTEIIKTLTNK